MKFHITFRCLDLIRSLANVSLAPLSRLGPFSNAGSSGESSSPLELRFRNKNHNSSYSQPKSQSSSRYTSPVRAEQFLYLSP